MKIQEYNYLSATNECNIYACAYKPDNEIKGIFVINHGMAEHQKRYKSFIDFLVDNNYAVYMLDMANHGKSNQDINLTGYFGKKDGYRALVNDFKTLFDIAKKENPDKKIIVMGHSMGSFVVRCFTAWYSNEGFDAAIYMGTGGPNPIAGIGDKISSLIAKTTGYTKKVKLLDTMTFGSYNDKFEKRTGFDWLTKDNNIVDEYIKDDYCGFLFSAQGMNDLVKINIAANSEDWYQKVNRNLNILLISGDMDPVGEYGKGIKTIYDKLVETNHKNVTLKFFKNDRHEVLNELDKDDVYNYIINYANNI